jgi:hypothetical protein
VARAAVNQEKDKGTGRRENGRRETGNRGQETEHRRPEEKQIGTWFIATEWSVAPKTSNGRKRWSDGWWSNGVLD